MTAGIKQCKSIIKKKKKKHDLNSITVLVSNALIDLRISHNEFLLINNVLKKYNDMKEKINKNANNK